METLKVGLELEAPFETTDQLYWLERNAPRKGAPVPVSGEAAVYHQDGVSLEIAQTCAYDTAYEAVDNLRAAFEAAQQTIGLGQWPLGWGNFIPAGIFLPRVRELGCEPDIKVTRSGEARVRRAPMAVRESAWRDSGCHINIDLPEPIRADLGHLVPGLADPMVQAQCASHPGVVGIVWGFQEMLREHYPELQNPQGRTWYRSPGLCRMKTNGTMVWVELRSAPSVILADAVRASSFISNVQTLASTIIS